MVQQVIVFMMCPIVEFMVVLLVNAYARLAVSYANKVRLDR